MILFLLNNCNFGNLFREIGNESAKVTNMKVVHFYVLIEIVQKD